MSARDIPPVPGSHAAINAGCTCPVSDNAHGEGVPVGGQTMYWTACDCPLHGEFRDNVDKDNAPENY